MNIKSHDSVRALMIIYSIIGVYPWMARNDIFSSIVYSDSEDPSIQRKMNMLM